MPYDGNGQWHPPSGTHATPLTPISSAAYNAFQDDNAAAHNSLRPIVSGGTGASNAADARSNLAALKRDGSDWNGDETAQAAFRLAIGAPLRGHIFGLEYSTFSGSTFSVSAGECASEQASPILMTYAGQTGRDLATAYGTGSGCRFDSSVSDGTWHNFVISDGTTVAFGSSKSLDPTGEANYPAGYTHYRRISSMLRVSGSLLNITQNGDVFARPSSTDWSSTSARASALIALSVPTGIVCAPILFSILFVNASSNVSNYIGSAARGSADYRINYVGVDSGATSGQGVVAPPLAYTNTSAQIYYAVVVTDGSIFDNQLMTVGWVDHRGRLN